MVTVEELAELSPNEPAPPLIVANHPGHDSLYEHTEGHHPERMLPLIGNNHPTRWFPRPHILDVVFDGGQHRVYADTVHDALAAIIGSNYDELVARSVRAEAAVAAAHTNPDVAPAACEAALAAAIDADAATFAARAEHAHSTRLSLQAQINHADNSRDLDDYERRILAAAADPAEPGPGAYPSTHPLHEALYEVPTAGPNRDTVTVDQLLWNPPVKLALSTADYAPYSDVAAPASILEHHIDGYDGALVVPGEPNLVWLRPDTAEDYLWSLHHAGIIAVDVRPIDQPDDVFVDAWGYLNNPTAPATS